MCSNQIHSRLFEFDLNVVTRVPDQLQGEPAPPAAAPDEADRDRAEGRHGPVLQPVQVQHKQLLRG